MEDKKEPTKKPERRRSASRGRISSIFVPAQSDRSQIVQVPVPHEMVAPNLANNSKIDKRSELHSLIQFTKNHVAECKKEKEAMIQKYSSYKDYIVSKRNAVKEPLNQSSKNANKNEGDVRPRYFLNNAVKRFLELDDCGNEKEDLIALQRAVEFEEKKFDIKNETVEKFLSKMSRTEDDNVPAVSRHGEYYGLKESTKNHEIRRNALNQLVANLNV